MLSCAQFCVSMCKFRLKLNFFGVAVSTRCHAVMGGIHVLFVVGNFCFVFIGEIFKRRHLHFRNPSGQWWGQFAEMDKFSFLVNFRSIHSTVHSTVPEWDKKKLISKYADHKKSQKITKNRKKSQKIAKKSQKITTGATGCGIQTS